MCQLVKFHWKYLYACCDSKRENKKEADIWERKSVTLKYQKFGSNRTENFLTCHFKFWDIHLCVGGGCASICRHSFSLVNTFGWRVELSWDLRNHWLIHSTNIHRVPTRYNYFAMHLLEMKKQMSGVIWLKLHRAGLWSQDLTALSSIAFPPLPLDQLAGLRRAGCWNSTETKAWSSAWVAIVYLC